jgi:microcompartment protein CcmK/EutM
MLLARVEGNVTATRKHPSFAGWRLIICQPIGREGQPEGSPCVALDALGAGMHQRVMLSSDGLAARKAVGDDKSPARWMIIGIVDEITPGSNALEDAVGATRGSGPGNLHGPASGVRHPASTVPPSASGIRPPSSASS